MRRKSNEQNSMQYVFTYPHAVCDTRVAKTAKATVASTTANHSAGRTSVVAR